MLATFLRKRQWNRGILVALVVVVWTSILPGGQLFDRFDDLRGAHVEKRNSPRRLLNCGAQATPG